MQADATHDFFCEETTSTAVLDEPADRPIPARDVRPEPADAARIVKILGVRFADLTQAEAIDLIEDLILHPGGRPHGIYIANAHTLNLAAADPGYRAVLNAGDYVFNDGTGVRWAARLQGVRLRDNLVGTDLVPALFRRTAGRGYSYFLLGAAPGVIGRAAAFAAAEFPGWTLAGHHHGYVTAPAEAARAITQINAARPDVLLVGMGNPRQEQWIHDHLAELRVPVCMGIGGLFDLWGGDVTRAPAWLRRLGHEWIWRLLQQPRDKARRYLLGNPLFLARAVRERFL